MRSRTGSDPERSSGESPEDDDRLVPPSVGFREKFRRDRSREAVMAGRLGAVISAAAQSAEGVER